jgi:hypothetical protein
LITTGLILPKIRNVLDKFVEKIRKILCPIYRVFENRSIYKIRWKNKVQPGRPQMTIWRRRIACWIPKATDTHTQYVILMVARSHLNDTLYVHCLSCPACPAQLRCKYISNSERSTEPTVKLIGLLLTDVNNTSEQLDCDSRVTLRNR